MRLRYRWTFLLAALVPGALPAAAQAPGTCAPAEAEAVLDVGNIRARIFGDGPLFWRRPGRPAYEVPRGRGTHALYHTSLWVGGYIAGELRTAAARYGRYEFWPGPYDPALGPPAECARYDRLWSVYRADVERFDATGEATDDLREWPYHLGAPVFDGDGDPTNYDLDGGDRPALVGDQTIWWVMNDAGNEHGWTKTAPLGLEVHGTAFAYDRPRSYVGDATFYRYVFINRNAHPIEDAYVGLYVDPDLGNLFDDYVGADSTLHLAYAYNADDEDEGAEGYGAAPPAIGLTFLRSPTDSDDRDNDIDGRTDEAGEQQGLSHFLWFGDGGGVTESPETAQDHYHYLRGRWKDGRPLTLGGQGFDFSETPVNYSYPGDPVTGAFWSERNLDGTGTARPLHDRWFVASTGPFRLAPGDSLEIAFAFVWARGEDHLDSVTRLRALTRQLRRGADAILQPTPVQKNAAPGPAPVLGFAAPFPNPFTDATTIRYSLPQAMDVRLALYDALGREVAVLAEGRQAVGVHAVRVAGAGLPPGLYLARLRLGFHSFTRTLVRAR